MQKTRELRRKLKSPPSGLPAGYPRSGCMASEIIDHDEPFDVAGRRLDLDQYRAQYDAILSRHKW